MRFAKSSLLAWSFGVAAMFGLLAPRAMAAEELGVLAITASSSDGMLWDAVDGEATTYWQNKGNERDAWLAVRFEAPAAITGVRLETAAMGPAVAVDVETSADGEHYVPQLRNLHPQGGQLEDLTFARPASALYVRVRFRYTGDGKPPRYRVAELQALAAR